MQPPVLDLQTIDTTIPEKITKFWSLKTLKDNFVPGINVLGAGVAERDFEEKVNWALKNPDEALTLLGYGPKEIERMQKKDKVELLRGEIKKREGQINEEKKLRVEELDPAADLGVKRLRIHYGGSYYGGAVTALDNLQDEDGNFLPEDDPEFRSLKDFYRKWMKSGGVIEFCLGPGKKKYKTSDGTYKTNKTECYDPKTKSFKEEVTEYHIPDNEDELRYYSNYCQFMTRHFPEAEFCFWVEPNLNYDDNGIFQHSELKGAQSTGRDPEKYADVVLTASKMMRKTTSNIRLGINIAFVDLDYVKRCLEQVEKQGNVPEVIDYVSFNPYRDLPENSGPFWNCNLTGKRGGKGKFDWKERHFSYEEEVLQLAELVSKFGLTLQVGESGWRGGKKPGEKRNQVVYNLRGWILNRFLWIPDTPWRMRDPITSEVGEASFAFVESRSLRPRPSYYAYQVFNRLLLEDITPLGELREDSVPELMGRVFQNEKSKERLLVLWMAVGADQNYEDQPIRLQLPEHGVSGLRVIDSLDGKDYADYSVDRNTLRVTVKDYPLIVILEA